MRHRKRTARPRRSSGGSNANVHIKAIVLTSVSALFLISFLAFYFIKSQEAGEIDKNFCYKGTLPEITAVLIDHTDHISAIQKASIERRLGDAAGSVTKNGSIRFFSVDNVRDKVLDAEVSLCSPGNKKVSELSGNNRLVKKRYDEKFAKILESKLAGILTAKTADESPIMEAAQSVAVTSFLGEKNDAPIKRLILVSDLLEHTRDFTLYRGVPDFEQFKQTAHWAKVQAELHGVDVEIYFLKRANQTSVQMDKLKEFWRQYFQEQGAHVDIIEIAGTDA